jgi:hypothetical protein
LTRLAEWSIIRGQVDFRGTRFREAISIFQTNVFCEQCGEPIRLRSFRLPPRTCPHCGRLRVPADARGNFGCLVLLPAAIGAMVAFGLLGALVGRALAPFVNDPQLAWRLGFFGALDGLGIVGLVHIKLYQGQQHQHQLSPAAAFLTFVLIGMKCGQGLGLASLIIAGIVNGIVACAIAFATLGLLTRPTLDAQ